jgi:hypothetical protein
MSHLEIDGALLLGVEGWRLGSIPGFGRLVVVAGEGQGANDGVTGELQCALRLDLHLFYSVRNREILPASIILGRLL